MINEVYIIDDADTMTREAQNCLLKTLEEPPEFANIILIGSNESSFLSTIKSRCTIIKFNPISDEQVKGYIKEKYGYDCFADDTGLEIKSLNNEPGVYSARYAGNDHNSEKNMQKVLENLKGKNDRSACFRTCIALITGNNEYLFEGKIEGEIITEKKGESGFGYDPIFVPDGYTQTFAELGNDIKNKISHRALAVKKLINFLQPIK